MNSVASACLIDETKQGFSPREPSTRRRKSNPTNQRVYRKDDERLACQPMIAIIISHGLRRRRGRYKTTGSLAVCHLTPPGRNSVLIVCCVRGCRGSCEGRLFLSCLPRQQPTSLPAPPLLRTKHLQYGRHLTSITVLHSHRQPPSPCHHATQPTCSLALHVHWIASYSHAP